MQDPQWAGTYGMPRPGLSTLAAFPDDLQVRGMCRGLLHSAA